MPYVTDHNRKAWEDYLRKNSSEDNNYRKNNKKITKSIPEEEIEDLEVNDNLTRNDPFVYVSSTMDKTFSKMVVANYKNYKKKNHTPAETQLAMIEIAICFLGKEVSSNANISEQDDVQENEFQDYVI